MILKFQFLHKTNLAKVTNHSTLTLIMSPHSRRCDDKVCTSRRYYWQLCTYLG